jgi:hypothetical protein
VDDVSAASANIEQNASSNAVATERRFSCPAICLDSPKGCLDSPLDDICSTSPRATTESLSLEDLNKVLFCKSDGGNIERGVVRVETAGNNFDIPDSNAFTWVTLEDSEAASGGRDSAVAYGRSDREAMTRRGSWSAYGGPGGNSPKADAQFIFLLQAPSPVLQTPTSPILPILSSATLSSDKADDPEITQFTLPGHHGDNANASSEAWDGPSHNFWSWPAEEEILPTADWRSV